MRTVMRSEFTFINYIICLLVSLQKVWKTCTVTEATRSLQFCVNARLVFIQYGGHSLQKRSALTFEKDTLPHAVTKKAIGKAKPSPGTIGTMRSLASSNHPKISKSIGFRLNSHTFSDSHGPTRGWNTYNTSTKGSRLLAGDRAKHHKLFRAGWSSIDYSSIGASRNRSSLARRDLHMV